MKSTDYLYIKLLVSLYEIETSEHFSVEIRSKAKNFKESMLKYSNIAYRLYVPKNLQNNFPIVEIPADK